MRRGVAGVRLWEYEGFVMQSMFVSCVHSVPIFNGAFSMTCILFMLVEDAESTIWQRHIPESVS